MKTYMLILDGAADYKNELLDNKTPLEYANTPSLSALASRGSMSLIEVIRNSVVPESDSGTMALLSYDPLIWYPGRGALEGIGIGCAPEGYSSIAFRVNFSSVDTKTGLTISRIASGLSAEQLADLTYAINKNVNLEKYDVRFKLVSFEHHRGVLCLYSKNKSLSSNVSNTDPCFIKMGVWRKAVKLPENKPLKCYPLDDSVEAYYTAEIINDFIAQTNALLNAHPVNIDRMSKHQVPANYLITRDGGICSARLPSFKSKYDLSLRIIGQLPAEKAIATLIGEAFEYSNSLDEDLDEQSLLMMSDRLIEATEDIIYFHIKGPDECGHENQPFEKVKAIERIDRFLVAPLIERISEDDMVVVTCDHSTPCIVRQHTSDKVPLLICGKGIQADRTVKFDEENAARGCLSVKTAEEVIPFIIERNK